MNITDYDFENVQVDLKLFTWLRRFDFSLNAGYCAACVRHVES